MADRRDLPGRAGILAAIAIDLASITRLVLNPWMPPVLADNLRSIIRGLPGCAKLKIEASALTNSARWKAAGKKLAG